MILVMVIVAVLLGYSMGRNSKSKKLKKEIEELEMLRQILMQEIHQIDEKNEESA